MLKGHGKKIQKMEWHPTADFTLASTSFDQTIKVWDVQKPACAFEFAGLGDKPWTLSWNYDGSMVGAIARDRKMYIVDPRQADAA